jgi:hypothetical protein
MIGSIVAALAGLCVLLPSASAPCSRPASPACAVRAADDGPTALALVRAIGARDLVLGIIVLLLLAGRNRAALELVLGVSILAAAGDAAAVTSGRSDARGPRLVVHIGGAAALRGVATRTKRRE